MICTAFFAVAQAEKSGYGLRMDKCFACDKPITTPEQAWADTRDAQIVRVGPECFNKIARAGDAGYQPALGGPKLYPLKD